MKNGRFSFLFSVGMALTWPISLISCISLLLMMMRVMRVVVSPKALDSFLFNLVVGILVELFKRLITDLVHSERSVARVVARSLRSVKFSSWSWTCVSPAASPSAWLLLVSWWHWTISGEHWWWPRSEVFWRWPSVHLVGMPVSSSRSCLISHAPLVVVEVRIEHFLWRTTRTSRSWWHRIISVISVGHPFILRVRFWTLSRARIPSAIFSVATSLFLLLSIRQKFIFRNLKFLDLNLLFVCFLIFVMIRFLIIILRLLLFLWFSSWLALLLPQIIFSINFLFLLSLLFGSLEWQGLHELSRLRFLITSLIGDIKLIPRKSYLDTRSDSIFMNDLLLTIFVLSFDFNLACIGDELIFLVQKWEASLNDFSCLQDFGHVHCEGIKRHHPVILDLSDWEVDDLANTSDTSDFDQHSLLFFILFSQKLGLVSRRSLGSAVRFWPSSSLLSFVLGPPFSLMRRLLCHRLRLGRMIGILGSRSGFPNSLGSLRVVAFSSFRCIFWAHCDRKSLNV